MQRRHLPSVVLLLILTIIPSVYARAQKAEGTVKDGWSVTPLPALGYDSDFGFMAGGFVDINYYGGLYPKYKHRLCLEALVYSKHASSYMFTYDTQYLIPGVRTQAKVFFDNNPLYWFYGFNGAVHDYDKSLNSNKSTSTAYYSMDRKVLNARIELEGRFSTHLQWIAKASFWNYWIRELDWPGYDSDNTLFRFYRQNGLIDDSEAGGGSTMEFQAGLKYDTRDIESAPTKGIYTDINFIAAPDIFNTGYDYLKLGARFRQYIRLGTDNVVLAYNLAYQGTIGGHPAFYSQPSLIHFKPSDGLGGATTLRGVLYNRIIGDDYLWTNIELRTRIMDFSLLKRRIFAVVTPFFDAGMILKPFRFDRQVEVLSVGDNVSAGDFDSYRSGMLDKARELHMSCGVGAQLIIDYNFIPTIMFGIPFDKRDGDYGLYMTLDYIF